MMRIAGLALQGAFLEHEQMLQRLGVETVEIRQLSDWQQPKDGLILPGGESTTQTKLLHDLGLLAPITQDIQHGLPVFGTCAGLILLARQEDGEQSHRISTMDIDVCRNAYGRQLGSFSIQSHVKDVGDDIPMTFIRAPYINKVLSDEVQILARIDTHIVAAQQGNQLVTAFHPELNTDTRIHQYFLKMVTEHL